MFLTEILSGHILLQHFHDRGIKVKGIDCGSYALEHFHPDMLQYFEKGDMETLLPRMAERGGYDVVNMDKPYSYRMAGSCFFRYSPGVMPSLLLNIRMKLELS